MFVTDPESAAVPITYWPLLSDIIIDYYPNDSLAMIAGFNPLVPELFCPKIDLLEIVSFSCTFLQHAVR